MSASKYAHTINEQRYKLLEQLVTKLLHVEQGDENFELARDFCVQKAWFNIFPAVNPRETEAFYADLVARLEADSQTTKASALSALTHKLLALKLASAAGVPDLNHNLLQLLASLSDQPLSSSLDLSPDVLDLLFNPAHRLLDEQQQHQQQTQGEQASLPGNTQHFQRLLRGAAAGRTAAADAGSMSDEYDPYGDDSSLSDWDEGEGKQQQQQHWGHQPLSTDTQQPAPEESLQQSGEQHQQEQQQQPALTDGRRQPAATTARASRPGVEQLPYGCVVPAPQQPLAKLQALRQAHTQDTQAASVPPEQQQLCLSEHYLAQQVLRVLQGLPALGFAIKDARDLNKQQQEQQANGQQQQQQPGSCGTDDSSAGGSASSSGALSSEQFYGVDPRVSTPHMPSHALHALLQDAAAAGTCHRQMRALVQQLAYGSMVSNSLQVTPCLRALGAALQQQLDSMGCQLADLQRQLQQEHEQRCSSSSGADGSRLQPQHQQQQGNRGLLLRYFRREARPVVARLQLLHCTVFGILRQLSGPPAAVSAGLIDGLAAAVQAASADKAAGPQVVAGAAALLHLLLSSCVPLSRALAQWLWCAEDSVGALSSGCQQQAGVSVCSSDFFIVRNASRDVAAVHPSFWHKAYGFSTRDAADAAAAAAAAASSGAAANRSRPGTAAAADVCCPAVLAPFVQSIMTAGKSMRLLDYMEQEDLKRSSLCSSSSASVGTDAVASGVAQQQQRACALPVSSGGALQRQPSTPRRRRPSSCSGRPGSSSTAAAGGGCVTAGRLSRQPSFSGRPGIRPASAAAAAAAAVGAAAQPGKAGSRRKWDAAPQQPASPGVAAAAAAAALYAVDRNAVARRVGLQLAAAAAMAGQQLIEDELPHEFIRSANYVLHQEQELQAQAHATMQQHKQYLQHCSGHSAQGNSSAPDLLLERLESVAAALARPHALATAGTAAQGQQVSLRDALAAARKARSADAAVLGGAGHALEGCAAAPRQQQAVQVPAQPPAGAAAAAAEAPTASADSRCSAQQQNEAAESQSPPAAPGSPSSPADISPAAPPAAGADAGSPDAHQDGGSNDAHSSSSSSSSGGLDVVPKLTVWRDQLEAKLTSAHQHLQCIAPWQQQQEPACSADDNDTHQLADARHTQHRGSKAAPTGTHASTGSRNWLLQTAATKVPGHFTGSLAELWPLKPVTGLKELAASGASWLQGAAWPGCDLEWLLQHPPAHLPAVQQLLWSTLVQPVRTRVELVDRQLMSSLMGEWGMLQQLQGLVNAFLITSPSMVEWVEALFSVVETAKLCAPRSSRGSGECSTPPASKAVSRVGGAGGTGCDSPGVFVGSPGVGTPGASAAGQLLPVTVEDLDLCSLEALLQDCILSADPDEVLPDPRALLITINREALAELREQQEKRRKALLAAGPPPAAAAAAGGAVRQQPAVGLMLCSKEWAGLELQHSGSWQLSLVYTDEQLRFFGQVWRVMLQLRWVRRRVGAQAVAHRSSAAVNDLTARDRLEAAQVAAAVANNSRARPNSAGSFRQQQAAAYGRQPGDAAGAVLEWLTGKEELLLLQEMNHFLSCWHSYVMDSIRVRAWSRLEEVLLSAKSLDQVHSATQKFFSEMCNLCSMLPRDSRRNNVWDAMRQRLENLLDHALAAAAAAGRLYAARQKLQELQDLPGREEHVQAWWLELAEARSRLQQAGRLWQAVLGQLLKSWAVLKKNNVSHALDELSDLLDMNGYFRQLERMAVLKAATAPAM